MYYIRRDGLFRSDIMATRPIKAELRQLLYYVKALSSYNRPICFYTTLSVSALYKTGLIHSLSLVHFLEELMIIRFQVADA